MTKIGVNGALGKMGQRILLLAQADPAEFLIAAAFESPENNAAQAGADLGVYLGMSSPMGVKIASLAGVNPAGLANCDAVIDFSGPAGAEAALTAALQHKKALVIGSTGLTADFERKIADASKAIPVVYSSNMSVGVNVVLDLLAEAARKLPADFDIEITEAHHRHKKDAPSGTAFSLAKAIAQAKGWVLKDVLRYRGEGKVDKDRPSREIGMQVIRAGEIVGDHTVLFAGPAETIEITHRAQSRDTFARGALRAAQFAAKAKPGLYSMKDVLA